PGQACGTRPQGAGHRGCSYLGAPAGPQDQEMRSAPRAVLDTNVVLSALLFTQGRLARLRLAWQRTSFHPLVSKATTQELIRALTYSKSKLATEDQRELLADYLPYCTPVSMPIKP